MEYPNNPITQQISLPTRPWFKSMTFKGVLIAIGVIAVLSIVLFNQQIGNLLRFFGSKAALDTDTITLQGDSTLPGYFLSNGYTAEELDPINNNWVSNNTAVTVDNTDRLILNP